MPSPVRNASGRGRRRTPLAVPGRLTRLTSGVLRTHGAYQRGAHSTRGRTALVTVDAAMAAFGLSQALGAEAGLVDRLAPQAPEGVFADAARAADEAFGDRGVVARGLARLARPAGAQAAPLATGDDLAEYVLVCSERFRQVVDGTKGLGKREKAALRREARARLESDMSGLDFLVLSASPGPGAAWFAVLASVSVGR